MKTVIIHGKRVGDESPRAGRPEADLWGVTRGNVTFWKGRLTDWTEWFDLHPLVPTSQFVGIRERRPDAWAWYCSQDSSRPIWLQAPEDHPPAAREMAQRMFDMVPGARRFPIGELQARFPINREPNRFFICQMGMMIARACMLGYEHIILNGVGVSSRADFQIAHIDTLYWIGFARGMGIEVSIEGPSTYHTPRQIYAYDKFNYKEFARAQAEMREIDSGEAGQRAIREGINASERARGRPARFRMSVPKG